MRTKRKKKKKQLKNTIHFTVRLKQRYKMKHYDSIVINKKKVIYRKKQTHTRSKILTVIDNIIVLIIYSNKHHVILTALPINRKSMKEIFDLYRLEKINLSKRGIRVIK